MSDSGRSRGLSLIEVVIFIVVLGIGIAGIVTLYGQLTKASVDPLVRKQALAIASSLMEEIQLRGFTYCDPDDSDVYTATSSADCAVVEVVPNPPGTPNEDPTESRYGPNRFDNVNDYNGFEMEGANIRDVTGNPISGLTDYKVSVNVQEASGDFPATDPIPLTEALRITVSVIGPAGVSVSLQGYRLRYAPNSP